MSSLICPVCGPHAGASVFEKKQRQFYACQGCGVRLQWPLPDLKELQEYYDQEFARGMYRTFTEAQTMKERTAEYRLHKVLRWTPPTGKWLDIGCANGVFVSAAAAAGAQATGIELSGVAVDQAQAAGLAVKQARIEELSVNERFDCITAFDVIEHVLDPRDFLTQIAQRLTANGVCVLSLPNVESIFARLMGRNWWFYIPEEHLYYFSPRTIRLLAERVGLETLHASRLSKPLTFAYGLTQFKEFNPLIYRALRVAALAIPARLQASILPFYIGEMLVVLKPCAN